jgi:hypothetical protein
MIGRSNARRGARRMFTVLQNKRLNQHLAYTILDEVRYLFRRATGRYSTSLSSVDCSVISGGVYMTMTSATSAAAISSQDSYDVYCRLRRVITKSQSMTYEYDERCHSTESETSYLHTGLHDV